MQDVDEASAFGFEGTWREYLPIALSNLALTIVTLGIYRFWAKARERRYLWSRTRFIEDRLEWTGTGREMFIGALVVIVLFSVPLLALNVLMQGLILRGEPVAAGLLFAALWLFLSYVAGFARFRALRYRLSRSLWRGIRGGSDDPGFRYGVSALWKPVAGFLALGLLIPWSMVSLWNERWNAMRFGTMRFEADASSSGLLGRWILLLVSPFIALVLLFLIALPFGVMAGMAQFANLDAANPVAMGGIIAGIVLFAFGFYFIIALIGLGYYAAFVRQVIDGTRLETLNFTFTAKSMDWLKLFLGDVALVVLTLGIGICMLGYRHWAFFIRHLDAYGEIDAAALGQSQTAAPREAEGFADAFDIGAL
jgi:uncharacterized membrane protein YjgN (DUF898 family)